jgi:hypothetical protein
MYLHLACPCAASPPRPVRTGPTTSFRLRVAGLVCALRSDLSHQPGVPVCHQCSRCSYSASCQLVRSCDARPAHLSVLISSATGARSVCAACRAVCAARRAFSGTCSCCSFSTPVPVCSACIVRNSSSSSPLALPLSSPRAPPDCVFFLFFGEHVYAHLVQPHLNYWCTFCAL